MFILGMQTQIELLTRLFIDYFSSWSINIYWIQLQSQSGRVNARYVVIVGDVVGCKFVMCFESVFAIIFSSKLQIIVVDLLNDSQLAKLKQTILSCYCHETYNIEAIGLKKSNYN